MGSWRSSPNIKRQEPLLLESWGEHARYSVGPHDALRLHDRVRGRDQSVTFRAAQQPAALATDGGGVELHVGGPVRLVGRSK